MIGDSSIRVSIHLLITVYLPNQSCAFLPMCRSSIVNRIPVCGCPICHAPYLVLYPVSCIMYPVSCIPYSVSCIVYPVSCIYPISDRPSCCCISVLSCPVLTCPVLFSVLFYSCAWCVTGCAIQSVRLCALCCRRGGSADRPVPGKCRSLAAHRRPPYTARRFPVASIGRQKQLRSIYHHIRTQSPGECIVNGTAQAAQLNAALLVCGIVYTYQGDSLYHHHPVLRNDHL